MEKNLDMRKPPYREHDLPVSWYFVEVPLYILYCDKVDREQSLFFFRFSKGSARTRARAAKSRDARNEGSSPHQSRAWPFAYLAFCSTDYRKKRDCSLSSDKAPGKPCHLAGIFTLDPYIWTPEVSVIEVNAVVSAPVISETTTSPMSTQTVAKARPMLPAGQRSP